MKQTTVYENPYEISGKLSEFKVTIKELQEVARAAIFARNEATSLHPSNAPGTYSYMAGVAALRMIFIGKDGWEIYRCKGVEGIVNRELGTLILFQNVDFACGRHDPTPITEKGEGVIQLVDNPSDFLWDHMTEEDRNLENRHVWFFCVSSREDEAKAELSRPRAIKNGNFGTLAERIFVIQDRDWSPTPTNNTNENFDDDEDLEVSVTKKG